MLNCRKNEQKEPEIFSRDYSSCFVDGRNEQGNKISCSGKSYTCLATQLPYLNLRAIQVSLFLMASSNCDVIKHMHYIVMKRSRNNRHKQLIMPPLNPC